ncbi:hypothetical protein NDU88_003485 [Pleurodeles waltl]|uniref:Uncharacterized protein n=1 Tax=Pleurodeles waltl TaxID=8319 RepID=A0AAV7NI85_PLEWA|nr:hypothetical protein NDU88_003485 [Pleurodeles waltl]
MSTAPWQGTSSTQLCQLRGTGRPPLPQTRQLAPDGVPYSSSSTPSRSARLSTDLTAATRLFQSRSQPKDSHFSSVLSGYHRNQDSATTIFVFLVVRLAIEVILALIKFLVAQNKQLKDKER